MPAEKVPSVMNTSQTYIGSLATTSMEYHMVKDSGTVMKEAKKDTINAKTETKTLEAFNVFG